MQEAGPGDGNLSFKADDLWAHIRQTNLDRLDEATACKDSEAIRRAFERCEIESEPKEMGSPNPPPAQAESATNAPAIEQAPEVEEIPPPDQPPALAEPAAVPPAAQELVPITPPAAQIATPPATAQPSKRSFSFGLAVGCVVGMVIGSSLTFWAVGRRGETPGFQAKRSLDSAKGRLSLAAGILKNRSRLAKFSPDEIARMRRGVETGDAALLPEGLLSSQFAADLDSKVLRQFDEDPKPSAPPEH